MPAFCISTATSVTLVRLTPIICARNSCVRGRSTPPDYASAGANGTSVSVRRARRCRLLFAAPEPAWNNSNSISSVRKALERSTASSILETSMRDPDTRELGRQNTRSESRRQLQWLCATLDVLALELIDAAATDLASH